MWSTENVETGANDRYDGQKNMDIIMKIPNWETIYPAFSAVNDLGLDQNSIFVFTSDHGELFGAHGRRAKNIFYDEAVRVPFLVEWAGHIPAGRKDFCFNTVDIMPTLLSLMGLNYPEDVEGEDLSECLTSNADNPEPSLMMGTGPTAMFGSGKEWRAVRDKRFTYAVYRVDKSEYLFDNLSDPYQTVNLANDPVYREEKLRLKKSMYEKMQKIGDNFDSNLHYISRWVKKRRIVRTATLNDKHNKKP